MPLEAKPLCHAPGSFGGDAKSLDKFRLSLEVVEGLERPFSFGGNERYPSLVQWTVDVTIVATYEC